MNVEDRLRKALAARAAEMASPPDRWDAITRRGAAARRHRQWRATAISLAGLCAAAVVAMTAAGIFREAPSRKVRTAPASQPHHGPPATVATVAPPSAISASTSVAPEGPLHGLPLWPFASLGEVRAWEDSYRSGGHQPWHLDPGLTAVSFSSGYLGYKGIDHAFTSRVKGSDAHVDVGFLNPNRQAVVSATVHLVRFGNDTDAPWEVVGTDDLQGLAVSSPGYGTTVSSPLLVGGKITGVDESIRLEVRSLAGDRVVGQACCLAAGGTDSPWRLAVTVDPHIAGVVTISASTGGHLASVERFSVTGVRVAGNPLG